MIIVHHLENSRSQRVLWLLEELGLAYEVKRYERNKKTMLAPPELRAVHPLGKSPVITDGDLTIAETGAIVEYLIETYGKGRLIPAAGTPERLDYRYWLHFAEGSAMTPLLLKLYFNAIPGRAPALIRPIAKMILGKANQTIAEPRIAAHIAYFEAELAKTGWFAGADISGADIMMSFPLEASRQRGNIEGSPNVKAFVDRIHARPAYQKALERGGPYSFA